uniref:Protein shisa-5 n=1 Tax=Sphenodon punctatus TaxID=8508 RepID=A0A8D0G676_SPHPU
MGLTSPSSRSLLALGFLLLLPSPPAGALGEDCKAYTDSDGHTHPIKSCPEFCCGTCNNRYCCTNYLYKFYEAEHHLCNMLAERTSQLVREEALMYRTDFNDDWTPSFPIAAVIGVVLFVAFIVLIIACFTCSCCCLYQMCRKPRPVVTTSTTTTVVQVPYPQQQGTPAGYPAARYPAAPYQGYYPVPAQPQPGMPVAPQPTSYPPPYPVQPSGPPAYHETVAAGAGTPYPISQPPYNPAYMDAQNSTY